MRLLLPLPLLLSGLCLLCSQHSRADWPQWRGPDGQGHAGGSGLPVKWSETENIAWRTEIPGRGWSSPVIADGKIWLTTALETKASAEEEAKRLKENTGDQPLTLLARVELRALCVDAASGKLLHNVLLLDKKDPQWVHKLNSYASPSPVLQDGKLFCHFGTLGTACLDTTAAKLVWTNEDTDLRIMHENGPGSSPVVTDGKVIFHMDGSDRQFIAALDAATGKLVWKTDRSGKMHDNPQFKKSYSTPILHTAGGKQQLISPGSDWLYSYDLSGQELWKLPFGELGFSITPRPVAGDGMIYLATGYGKSRILAVKADGTAPPEIAWTFDKGAPTMPSPLLAGGLLYFVNDGGMITCVDAKTGEEVFRERLGEPFSASPLATPEHLYFPGREGKTYVLKPGRSYELLATNALDGQQFASFAVDGNALFIRTDKALYCIGGRK